MNIMRLFLVILISSVAVAIASDTNQTSSVRKADINDGPRAGAYAPKAYKDAITGIIFYVETDGRHVTAINADGEILWHRNPFADAKLQPYRIDVPRIVYIGKTSQTMEAAHAKSGKRVVGISFDSSQFGELDVKMGVFTFSGQD